MTYFCRFIFVHYNAWKYVGSDVLWAGIVTNLASAIETEFGVMTSRIFCLLNVDFIQDNASSNERTLLINVRNDQTDEKLEDALKEYGVVKRFKKRRDKNQKWVAEVEYSNYKEADNARKAIKSNGIDAKKLNSREECCPLFCQFCKHFVKHPKTTLGLPNLCWLLLFYLAFICLLVIASQVAKAFDLNIYRVSLKTLRDVAFIRREILAHSEKG